ncbi:hypothetical protein [Nonomuraea sp. NPDC049141]|uniref:hypothetical protein n=1 Tax=unclassified Nonomuraea TaxID=2593643 RepID=UPI0033D53879
MVNRYRTLLAAVAGIATLATAAVAPAQASAVAPVSVTFAAAEDVFVSQAEPAKSFATATWMSVCGTACGSATAGQRAALTRFKVTGIPQDAEDVKVTLDVVSARTTDSTVSARPVAGGRHHLEHPSGPDRAGHRLAHRLHHRPGGQAGCLLGRPG